MASSDATTVTLECRFCNAKNRVPIERALKDLAAVSCGSCGIGLLRVHGEPLSDVTDEELAHPFDREALETLKKIPLAATIVDKLLGGTVDKLARFRMMASALRVGPKQAPRLWSLYLEAAGRLDVDPPPLFIAQSPEINAWAMGAGQPTLTVTTALIEHMDDRAICGVLGHELTHVRLGHVTYRTLVILMLQGALKILDVFGLAAVAIKPIQLALFRWYQMSELSADRGELLATGSLECFVRTQMTLAGGTSRWTDDLDVAAFIEQAHEAEAMRDSDLLLWAMEMLSSSSRTHPLNVWRVHHALRWAQSPEFFHALAGKPAPRALNG